jgi:hypothetical protein
VFEEGAIYQLSFNLPIKARKMEIKKSMKIIV